MATWYVDDTATGANDGTSWTDAYTSVTSITTGDTGDIVRVRYTHDEKSSTTWNPSLSFATTSDSDVLTQFISCDNDDTYVAGATFGTTNKDIRLNTTINMMYYRGFTIDADDEIGGIIDGGVHLDDCLIIPGNQSGNGIATQTNTDWRLTNCTWRPKAAATEGFAISNGASVYIDNLIYDATLSASCQNIVELFGDRGALEVRNSDLSNYTNLIQENPSTRAAGVFNAKFYRCKFPNFTFWPTISQYGSRIEAYDCDTGTDRNSIFVKDNTGQVDDDTGIYLDGTTDGTTGYSLKMVSTADAINAAPLRVHLATVPISSATATLTVELVEDNATALQDDEFWIEVDAPGSTAPTGVTGSSRKMNSPYETPANLTSSSKTWTGTGGFTNEDKRKVSLTLGTDTAAAFAGQTVDVYACLGPAAVRTVYVDPHITVS